jgi:hypothetical protein
MIGQMLVYVVLTGACFHDEPAPAAVDRAAEHSTYQTAKKEAGRDAQAHVRLALWCEAHGMSAERVKHLATAVLYDPSNALARGLMGLVAYQGKWQRPEDVSRQVQDDPRRKALMQEYLQRRARTSDKADDQWKLALWCEQNGLKDQAIAQCHAVLRRDPTREAAWKRLGFKKVGGHWVKPEWQAAQKQESEQQNRANKHWKPLLEKWREAIFGRDKARRAAAEEAMTSVADSRAVPMIWAVFVPKGTEGQNVAVRLLGQIDAPGASQALAMLALMSRSAEARRDAAQMLRRRDAREFAPLLIGMIRDPIKYEVKPVRGPGQPGELVIHDGTTKHKRLYTPPSAPTYVMRPSDYLSTDASGLPVITRYLGEYQTPEFATGVNSVAAATAMFGANSSASTQLAGRFEQAGMPPALSQQMAATLSQAANPRVRVAGNPRGEMFYASVVYEETMQIPIGQMMLEAQRAAQVAELQVAGDIRAIEAYNAPILKANRSVRQVLSETVGTDKGDDHSAWAKWLVDLLGFAYSPQKSSNEETTVVEQVPLAYQPQSAPILVPQVQGVVLSQHSCFGAGTPVLTIEGPRPIEDLLAGDDVLTQDPKTSELKYQPLVAVYHNPPNATFRVDLEGAGGSIVATGIHRLWKAGQGWVMVRDLKPGDVLRTLGGTAAVKSVTEERVQPVFNLRVADGESFFVGRSGVLAHDNSTINPTPEPFDSVEALREPGARPSGTRSVLGR